MKNKGSVTIYTLLSMILVVAALLSLLEGARYHQIRRMADLQTQLALEAIFSNYNTLLWEEYHLLACDQKDMQEVLIKVGNGRKGISENAWNLLFFQVDEAEITSNTRLTDGGGVAYVNTVAGYMEHNLLYEAAKKIYTQYEAIANLTKDSELDLSNIDKALDELKNLEEASETDGQTKIEPGKEYKNCSASTNQEIKNPLEAVKELQEVGILSLVVQDTGKLSKAKWDFANSVSKRELEKGVHPQLEERSWYHKVLLQQYLMTYLSSYGNKKENRCLSYELEYLIGQKNGDLENLQSVVGQLLMIRTAANLLYLSTDAVKQEEVRLLALALGGASLNPILINVIKAGLLTAWAFLESVLDVRGLLCGKRIPLLKNPDLWTLDIGDISTVTSGYAMAKEGAMGLTYEDYLGILLLFQEEKTLALRAMDVQEAAIRKKYELDDFRMDQLLTRAEVRISYEYHSANPLTEILQVQPGWSYTFSSKQSLGYY